jgi:predicted transposase YdaD
LGMAGVWDSIMKRLVKTYAQHFTNWLVAEATFVRTLNVELQSQHLFADALMEIVSYGEPSLLLIEFQSYRDPEMGRRLMEYSLLASREYNHCAVYPYVVYLRKAGEVAGSPYIRIQPDGQEAYRFYYRVIQLWEMPAEVFLRHGWPGLLPLVILTKGGKQPEVINEMIEQLVEAQEYDLLAVARLMGGLVFKEGSDESDWFKGRFHMFQDILRESWVYKEIGQEFLEQGREEERQEELQRQRQTVLSFVQRHFSELISLAKQQTDRITEPEVLQTVILRLLAAQTVEEARQILLNLDQSQNKN